ncbi:hypothetical protein Mal15_54290 [Stieleria maiorica]|uniref:Uncharacterized protein n=1 Tax=Stieleria maiorica TaxID=2795974 RepID=A0A5B9MJ08_9BACT|nr:hypothetical protein [Stieleria maiorica]QEG01353.1 hypothetical protein Mal15_54290 [Stieleria maiorica]
MSRPKLTSRQYRCYVQWLRIPVQECPPDHYRLLDLNSFESDTDRIRTAGIKRRRQIAQLAKAEEQKDAEAFVRHLSKVVSELLDPETKRRYDHRLSQRRSAAEPAVASIQPQPPVGSVAAAGTSSSDVTRRSAPEIDTSITPTPMNGSQRNRLLIPFVVAVGLVGMMLPVTLFLLLTKPAAPTESDEHHPAQAVAQGESSEAMTRGTTGAVTAIPSDPSPLQTAASVGSSAPLESIVKSNPTTAESAAAPAERIDDATIDETASPHEPESAVGKMASAKAAQPADRPIPNSLATGVPFAQLSSEFPLPEIPQVSTELSQSATAGKIVCADFSSVRLRLDSTAADLAGRYAFDVVDADHQDQEVKRWQVVAKQPDNPDGDQVQLGHFFIDDLNQLRFLWEMSQPFPKASQLVNSLLTVSMKNQQHTMQLRSAMHIGRQHTTISGKKIQLPLEIATPPSEANIGLRIVTYPTGRVATQHAPFRSDRVNPAGVLRARMPPILAQIADSAESSIVQDRGLVQVGESRDIDVDSSGFVRLNIALDRDNQQQYQLGSVARVKKIVSGRERYETSSHDELLVDSRKLTQTIQKGINEYEFAINKILAAQAEWAKLKPQYDALLRRANADPKNAARFTKQLAALRSLLLERELVINKQTKIRDNRMKSLPKSFETLGDLHATIRAVARIHNQGEFEFHLVALTEQGEISLLRADGKPNVDRIPVEIPPFRLTGNWIRLQQGLMYNLTGTDHGGGVSIKNVFKKNVPTLTGTWKRNGNAIAITTNVGQENYQLHEDVIMRSGAASLFRIP